MPRLTGARQHGPRARHRLGTAGLVHCVNHPEVADALAEYRRGWLTALITPARHSWWGLRRRAGHPQRTLAPAT